MKTKRYYFVFVVLLTVFVFSFSAFAQLEDAIEQFESDNTKGYLQPMVDALGANLNSGLHHTARVPFVGLNLYVGVAVTGTIIPDDDLIFMGTPPEPYPQNKVETATVFGEEGAVVPSESGLNYVFQNGQIQGNFIPLAVPHLEIGSLMGTKVKIRYFASDLGEGYGDLKLMGWGFQHSISRYIPLCPIDISAHYFNQSLDIGDILEMKASSFGVQGSRKLGLFTAYGGLSMDNTTMDVEYAYKEGNIEEEISIELESKGNVRFTIGASLRFLIFTIHGDYNFGKQRTAMLGIGFGY